MKLKLLQDGLLQISGDAKECRGCYDVLVGVNRARARAPWDEALNKEIVVTPGYEVSHSPDWTTLTVSSEAKRKGIEACFEDLKFYKFIPEEIKLDQVPNEGASVNAGIGRFCFSMGSFGKRKAEAPGSFDEKR